MTKINHEEYEILKSLRDSWEWIARDNDTILWVYANEPKKHENCWDDLSGVCESVDSDLFQFIQWGDKNPFGIAELIEEYEKGYEGSWEHAIEFSEELFGESEETEVRKDIEWAIKEIEGLEAEPSQNYPHDEVIEKEIVLGILSQLDEPETLSSDWIGDNVEYAYYMTPRGTYSSAKAVIDPGKLKNLLVPKQELPVIPQFVAEWIESNKEFEEKWNDYSKEDAMNDTIHFTIYGLFADYPATNSDVELRKPVIKWLSVDRGNYFKLVNSVRYGYEVEERELTVKEVIEEHIELLKKQEVAVNLKPYYDLWEGLKDE